MIRVLLISIAFLLLPMNSLAEDIQPGPRWGHVFVYDESRDQFLLFGGANQRGSYLSDTWILDENGWHQLEVESPGPRGFQASAWDSARNVIMVHGGRGNDRKTFSDLWQWDGTNWSVLDSEGPFISDHHEMAYLPLENAMLLYGGWTGKEVTGDTWLWNGEWSSLSGTPPGPNARSAFAMAYNPLLERVELHGGLWLNGQYADSWIWANGRWRAITGPYDNSSIDHHAMIFDALNGQMLIFGGKDYRYTPRAETRILDVNGKVKTVASEGPEARHSTSLAYDNKRGRVLMYGGKKYDGDEQLPLDDLWSWQNGKWSRLITTSKAP